MTSMQQAFKFTSACIVRRAARGFSLISAIFLLVVLAALGAVIVNIATVQHTTAALDVQGARAYQAARAGVEWALFQAFQGGGAYCPGGATATDSFALPSGTTLGQFSVTVTCTPVTYTNTSAVIAVSPNIIARQVTATACNQPSGGACPNGSPGPDYVQRVISVRLAGGT